MVMLSVLFSLLSLHLALHELPVGALPPAERLHLVAAEPPRVPPFWFGRSGRGDFLQWQSVVNLRYMVEIALWVRATVGSAAAPQATCF